MAAPSTPCTHTGRARALALALALPALACSTAVVDESDGTGSAGSITAASITTMTGSTSAGATAATDDGSSGESQGESSGEPATTSGTSGGTTGSDFKFDLGETTGLESTGPDDSMCPCADKLDLIYVLSDDRELWTYDPASNAFALVGGLGCPTQNGTFSMGIGRDGYAWIQDTAPQGLNSYIGDLYRLDVNNPANCTDPGYTPGANGWIHFGMAFVSESADDPCDRLYGQHWNGQAGAWSEGPGVGKLGVFDEVALQMNTIGPTNYNGAELTGTGDGRLYAFGGVPDAKLIQFDKQSAAELDTKVFNGFPLTNAFAFAFWGGDFYFFTNSVPDGVGTNSKVTKLDYDGDMSLTTVNNNAPILVVGAGVSTCAPLKPPS
ncbi:MAG: hypothetical protein R3B09_33505 [Nannocystaceae bacterium]